MNHWHRFRVRLSGAKPLVWAAIVAQLLWTVGAARPSPWEKRVFWLAGECWHLSIPADWSAIRGSGESMAAVSFSEDGLAGLLLLSATPVEEMKRSLEESGLSVAEWLIDGIVAGERAAVFSVAQLARAAGFQGAVVEDAGERKALVYEVASLNAPAAVAVCIQGETVLTVQVSLEGAEDCHRQRELARSVAAGLGPEASSVHAFGRERVHVPADWRLCGDRGSMAIGFELAQNETSASAVACLIRLSNPNPTGLISAGQELTEPMRALLLKMLVKAEEAGLTEDDGLVRLYDLSGEGGASWVALFVDGDAALVCGVQWEGAEYRRARETVELLARGMEAMRGSGRGFAVVAGE